MSRERVIAKLKFSRAMYIYACKADKLGIGDDDFNKYLISYWGGECLKVRKMLDKIDGKKK